MIVLLLLVAVIGGVIALCVVLVVVASRNNRKQQARLMAWARANGLSYTPSVPRLAHYWSERPFIGGRNAQALDVLTGQTPRRRQFCCFTYQYVIYTGKTTLVIRIAVTAMRLPAALPRLALTAETVGTKIARVFGGQDITLESDDFNNFYRVESDDQRFAYGVLHPRMMEWLLGPGRALTPWRIVGDDLICWRRETPKYEWLLPQLGLMETVIDQIPQQVWSDYGRRIVT